MGIVHMFPFPKILFSSSISPMDAHQTQLRWSYWLILVVLVPSFLIAADTASNSGTSDEQFFANSVLPILKEHCFECHAGKHEKGGLKLDTRSALVAGGESGAAIDGERPEASMLLEAIRYEGIEMPPKGKLPAEKIDVLTRWVAKGAPYSPDMQGSTEEASAKSREKVITEKDKAFWAFQTPKALVPPQSQHTPFAATPIDAFIAAGLDKANLDPNPMASPAAAIRRLHYDLTGLPPPFELVTAFEADPSERHWREIVDRLMASPQYGERWGRHWMDLVRYAESNSYERDDDKPEVWRYRDWVIRAFNEDLPYDEFIRDQLAGDERPFTTDRLIATGFYRLGMWDDEPVDMEQARFDDLDDIITTTSQVFLGLTVNCARCHDHKIDPFTQKDYYRLASFLAGINRYGIRGFDSVERFSLRPLVPPKEQTAYQEAVNAYRQRKAALEKEQRDFEKLVQPDLSPVEREEFRHKMNREPIISKRVRRFITVEQLEAYRTNEEQLELLEREKPADLGRALCITEQGSNPKPMHVLIRGNPHAQGTVVEPGFPEVLGGLTPEIPPSSNPETSGRRTVLANWIASDSNPLTARVMANRLWHYHFGRGLVRSPNDFGYQGSAPTHPELLDYLAKELVRHDWQLKPMHRSILLSRTYRMSSMSRDEAIAVDPLNDHFWRFDPRRLSAEEIRDSMLVATGQINFRMNGPWMFPKIEKEVLAGQSRPGHGWGNSSPAEQSRRSVYIHIKRSLAVPLLAAFDAAEPDFTCPARFATTQPTQALGMLNSEFLQQTSKQLAQLGTREGGQNLDGQINVVLRQVLQREIKAEEVQLGQQLVEQLQKDLNIPRERAFEHFCLVALNLNEFLYLD